MMMIVLMMMMMMMIEAIIYLFFQIVRADVVLCFDVVQLVLFLIDVQTLESLVRLIVQHHQISIAYIETRQVIARIFCIENIFVNNKRGTPSLRSVSTEYKEKAN